MFDSAAVHMLSREKWGKKLIGICKSVDHGEINLLELQMPMEEMAAVYRPGSHERHAIASMHKRPEFRRQGQQQLRYASFSNACLLKLCKFSTGRLSVSTCV